MIIDDLGVAFAGYVARAQAVLDRVAGELRGRGYRGQRFPSHGLRFTRSHARPSHRRGPYGALFTVFAPCVRKIGDAREWQGE